MPSNLGNFVRLRLSRLRNSRLVRLKKASGSPVRLAIVFPEIFKQFTFPANPTRSKRLCDTVMDVKLLLERLLRLGRVAFHMWSFVKLRFCTAGTKMNNG